jgi:hypothetical protein
MRKYSTRNEKASKNILKNKKDFKKKDVLYLIIRETKATHTTAMGLCCGGMTTTFLCTISLYSEGLSE